MPRAARMLIGLLALTIAVGQYAFTTRDLLDESQRGLDNLRLGECFDAPEGTDIIAGASVVECSEVHSYEVFGFGLVEDRTEFDAAEVAEEADQVCVAQFSEYVGSDPTDSQLGIMHLSPTLASWQSGDRAVTCLLYNPAGLLRNSMIRSGV